ncbi:conserved hypothetical protein [uncultured Desulfatiglans sp.]|nr:conserved hypothetical protein [uncultured Desulfatiglans sp.]
MLTQAMRAILADARQWGWVLEPEAKRLFALWGLPVPKFTWARDIGEALRFAEEIGYPVAAKVVSPEVVHKSEVKGVVAGIGGREKLEEVFTRFRALPGFEGVLVEEMAEGLELIVGAKIDHQFGPVILFGIGGTGVEIYKDSVLRMAPLKEKDVDAMLTGLQARPLLEGYRGRDPVDRQGLTRFLLDFSRLVMTLEERITSIDINPLFCSSKGCIAADARIMLPSFESA